MKKKILYGVLAFFGCMAVIFYWINLRLQTLEDDANKSVEMSKNLKSQLPSRDMNDYTYSPSEFDWKDNFLVLENVSKLDADFLY